MIVASVTAWAFALLTPWLRNVFRLQSTVAIAQKRAESLHAIDILVSDLKQAASTTLAVDPRGTNVTFHQQEFDDSGGGNTPVREWEIKYFYDPVKRSLERKV